MGDSRPLLEEAVYQELLTLEACLVLEKEGGVVFQSELDRLHLNELTLQLMCRIGLVRTTETKDDVAYAFTGKGGEIWDATKEFYLQQLESLGSYHA